MAGNGVWDWDPLGLMGGGSKGLGELIDGGLFGAQGIFGWLFGGDDETGTTPPPAADTESNPLGSMMQQIVPIAVIALIVFLAVKYGKKLLK
jgi:hypothetical protein